MKDILFLFFKNEITKTHVKQLKVTHLRVEKCLKMVGGSIEMKTVEKYVNFSIQMYLFTLLT